MARDERRLGQQRAPASRAKLAALDIDVSRVPSVPSENDVLYRDVDAFVRYDMDTLVALLMPCTDVAQPENALRDELDPLGRLPRVTFRVAQAS